MAPQRGMLALALLLLAAAALAEGPRALRVDPARSGDYLVADLEFENLFSRPIENTLRSGLPIVIDCIIEIQQPGGQGDRTILLRSELGYDVWEGIFSLRRDDLSRVFEDFIALRRACDRLEALPLAPLRELPPRATFHMRLRVAVSPFAGGENDRVQRWLAETVSDPCNPDAREFRLDLGGLIDSFFRSADRDKDWGKARRFGPYRLDQLRVIETESPLEENGS